MANPEGPLTPPITQEAQNPPAPQDPQALQVPHVPQVLHMPPLNLSHFKPEFSGKPDKDAEAH